MLFLGGQRIIGAGWMGYRSVYVDFVTDYTSGWLWQLYANRTLIGRTTSPVDRRIVGQLLDSAAPAAITLVRVDPGNILTDYGTELPDVPWNRFELTWSANSFPADTDHFDVTGSPAAGEDVDAANVLGRVPYVGDGDYSFVVPPINQSGAWSYAVTSRDNAFPLGNASAVSTVTVNPLVPPPDVVVNDQGNRFEVSIEAGVVAVSFEYGTIS